jgi:1,4-alpha-glucan branching enzyme
VWLKDKGYPGDPYYRDFNRDIGYERPINYLAPYIHSEHPAATGIKYYRNQWMDGSDIYDPQAAFRRCDEHANHFIGRVQAKVAELARSMDRKPVLVALFDTEHFGHWWHEGPTWLDLVIRKLAYDQDSVRLIHAADYLRQYPTNQVSMPTLSSWGYQGYSETWVMGRNHWIYPILYEAIDRFEALLTRYPRPEGKVREALNQYLRELLLAQSSDWAFILHQETVQDYAREQVLRAVNAMKAIEASLYGDHFEETDLKELETRNNLFQAVDLLSYM